MMEEKEEWIYCPICGGKTRLRLLQRTVLRDFPLFTFHFSMFFLRQYRTEQRCAI